MTTERTDRDAELVADIVTKHMSHRCGNTMITAAGTRCLDSPNNIADEIMNALSVESQAEANDRNALDHIASAITTWEDDPSDDRTDTLTVIDTVAALVRGTGRAVAR